MSEYIGQVTEGINYREPHACERCGTWIPHPNPRGKPQRYCSRNCQAGTRQPRIYTCQTCLHEWESPSNTGQPPRYCSEECRKDAAKARARAWYHNNPERKAAQPSQQPEYKARVWAAYYEANREELLERSARYWRENPEKVAAWHAARYARTRGAPEAEHFTLDEIFERDKGVCYLCGKDCPRNQATMDHVIPVSPPHCGPHTRANVKLAHRSCNTRKHTKLLHELAWYQPDTET